MRPTVRISRLCRIEANATDRLRSESHRGCERELKGLTPELVAWTAARNGSSTGSRGNYAPRAPVFIGPADQSRPALWTAILEGEGSANQGVDYLPCVTFRSASSRELNHRSPTPHDLRGSIPTTVQTPLLTTFRLQRALAADLFLSEYRQ